MKNGLDLAIVVVYPWSKEGDSAKEVPHLRGDSKYQVKRTVSSPEDGGGKEGS
jgi:hypothetical protein